MADRFDAGMKIDEADFQRQIEQAGNVPFTEELRLVVRGGYGLEARGAMNEAKQNALRKARKKLIAAVWAEHRKITDQHVFPIAVNQSVNTWVDEGPLKVKA